MRIKSSMSEDHYGFKSFEGFKSLIMHEFPSHEAR